MASTSYDPADITHVAVETRNRRGTVTRRVVCADVDAAYSVAMGWRKRTHKAGGVDTLPSPSTDITLLAMTGRPGAGTVIACLKWVGCLPTTTSVAHGTRIAVELGEQARWRYIDPGATYRGACLDTPKHGEPIRPARWHYTATVHA